MRTLGNWILGMGLLINVYSLLSFFLLHDFQSRSECPYLFLAGLGVAWVGATVRTLHEPGVDSAELKTQFSLQFVLLWLFPSVALIAALFAWDGPFQDDFANWNVRLYALIILLGAVALPIQIVAFPPTGGETFD